MSDPADKHWRMTAFIVRCAQRYGQAYVVDGEEPSFSRATVSDALALAEACVVAGKRENEFGDGKAWMVNNSYFDNYDLEALLHALRASCDAAENTYVDLHDDPRVERTARHIWTAIRLAHLALTTALRTTPGEDMEEPVQQAINWAVDREPQLKALVGADLICAMSSEESPEKGLEAVFGSLWPADRPNGLQ